MDFGANKTPVDIIKEGAFGAAQFRSKLVKMIIDTDSKFDDYSISRIGIMN